MALYSEIAEAQRRFRELRYPNFGKIGAGLGHSGPRLGESFDVSFTKGSTASCDGFVVSELHHIDAGRHLSLLESVGKVLHTFAHKVPDPELMQ